MKTRPVQVTVVAWFLMVTCVLSMGTTLVMLGNPRVREMMAKSVLPIWGQYTFMAAALVIGLVSGFFLLKGKRWARTLYVSWTFFAFALSFATSPMKWAMLPGGLVYTVVVGLLFLPNANAYFADRLISENENAL